MFTIGAHFIFHTSLIVFCSFTYFVAFLVPSLNQMTVCQESQPVIYRLFAFSPSSRSILRFSCLIAEVRFPLSGRKSLPCTRCPVKHPITDAYRVPTTADCPCSFLFYYYCLYISVYCLKSECDRNKTEAYLQTFLIKYIFLYNWKLFSTILILSISIKKNLFYMLCSH